MSTAGGWSPSQLGTAQQVIYFTDQTKKKERKKKLNSCIADRTFTKKNLILRLKKK